MFLYITLLVFLYVILLIVFRFVIPVLVAPLSRPGPVDPLEVERQQCVKLAMAELDEADRIMGVLPAALVTPAEIVMRGASKPISVKQIVKNIQDAKAKELDVHHGVMTAKGEAAMAKIRARHEAGIWDYDDWSIYGGKPASMAMKSYADLKDQVNYSKTQIALLEKEQDALQKRIADEVNRRPCSKCGGQAKWVSEESGYPDHLCDGYGYQKPMSLNDIMNMTIDEYAVTRKALLDIDKKKASYTKGGVPTYGKKRTMSFGPG